MKEAIETFLSLLRDSDRYIPEIFSKGSCFKLYKILKHLYPEAKPYMCGFYNQALGKDVFDHVVTKLGDSFYDIDGEYTGNSRFPLVLPMNSADMEQFEQYSFANMHAFLDCENCPYKE